MKKLLLNLLIVCSCFAEDDIGKLDKKMAITKSSTEGIVWHNILAPPFKIEGFAWLQEDKIFRRLPLEPDWPIREPVSNLADHTSGGQLHFQTNSSKILIRAKLGMKSKMYHMPSTGQSGFDLYIGPPKKRLYYKSTRFETDHTSFDSLVYEGPDKNKNILINFPLYNGVQSLEIGLLKGASLQAPQKRSNKGRFVVYGTSITQGGCTSRPGLSWTNILSRRLDYEFINLGFSGNGRGEPELAKLINQIKNKKFIILDYESNAGENMRQNLEPFIDILRSKNPNIPILVISQGFHANQIHEKKPLEVMQSLAQFQEELIKKKTVAGDQNLYFLNGKVLFGEHAHEATVDGAHPNSYGFMMMAEQIEKKIREILNK